MGILLHYVHVIIGVCEYVLIFSYSEMIHADDHFSSLGHSRYFALFVFIGHILGPKAPFGVFWRRCGPHLNAFFIRVKKVVLLQTLWTPFGLLLDPILKENSKLWSEERLHLPTANIHGKSFLPPFLSQCLKLEKVLVQSFPPPTLSVY